MVSLQSRPTFGVHYTGVSSISRRDIEKVKDILVEAIKKAREVIEPSKEEELVIPTIDFDID